MVNNHYIYTDFPEYDNTVWYQSPDGWNPIEDFNRYQQDYYQNNYYKYMYAYTGGHFRLYQLFYYYSYN